MRPNDPLLRMAHQIQRSLARDRSDHDEKLLTLAAQAARAQASFARHLRRIMLAHQREWHLTASRLQSQLLVQAGDVASACQELTALPWPSHSPPISLRSLIDDLRQLHSEFDTVDLSQRGQIIINTDPIELEGVHLGRFAIQLHLDRLEHKLNSSCFDCVPLDPNPASNSKDITHPHVQSRQLCAGDASVPIGIALKEGRICDAFCLVHAVLNNYNADSPYVSLDNWNGIACGDCGSTTDRDDLYCCENCGSDLCDDCISRCDLCESSCCRSCLETDRVSDRCCCIRCHKHCTTCHRIVDLDSVDDDSGLCPACLEAHSAEEQAEAEHQTAPNLSTQETNNESEISQCISTSSPGIDYPFRRHASEATPAAETHSIIAA